MAKQATVLIFDNTGRQGTAEAHQLSAVADEQQQILVTFEPDRQIQVPFNLLTLGKDGSYSLPFAVNELTTAQSQRLTEQRVIPLITEELQIHKRTVAAEKIRVTKTVQAQQKLVDIALMAEELEVKRVPINCVVPEPLAVRTEGDTIIVPLFEEVLVVQKQLWLKEEIHITKRQTERHHTEQVTLRREEAVIESVRQSEPNA